MSSLCHIGDGCQLDDEGGSCPNHPSIAISASLTPAVDTSRMEDQQHEEEEEEEGESTRQEIVEQVNIDVQEAIAGVEVGVGVVILGSAAQSEYGEVLKQTDSCCDHQQDLVMSYECPTDASATNAIAAASAAGEDKKLQYALRSNPKRSRRFFDPDYALELVSPSAPSTTATTTTISSVITAAAATVAPPAAVAGATAAAAASPAASAPIKKMNSLFSEKARACTECGKQFPSWKALFGHMRCHPERQWRGIQPPNSLAIARDKPFIKEGNADNSTTSQQQHNAIAKAPGVAAAATKWPSLWESESENSRALSHLDDSVDESDTESIEAAYMNGRDQESLKRHNWMRGKRSKRSVQDVVSGQFSESGTPPEEVMDERDMADCLVMLAFAAKSKADEPSDCDSGQEGLDWEGHSRPPRAAETREKMKEKKSYGCVQKSILFLAREGKAEKWEEDHEKVSWERKSKFECSTCKKTFRSHQALGGHRASHKKVKGCFARTNATEEVALQEVAEMTTTMMTMMEQQEEEPDDAAKKRPEKEEGPPLEDMSMGRFLQCSITCSEKMEEDQYDSAMAMERKKLKHQTSSCSSSSSIMAVTAAAGTLLMHHHQQQQQQQQQPKVHQCTICHRVFATGQALGGHKRCHWGGSAAPESSKKGTPKQDGDGGGGGCAPLQACLGISTSERSTELSKKARQDVSASFASAQAWMNVSEVTDKASEQLSELSRKGRQDSISEDDTKGVHAYAQNWLGAYVSSDKMVLGARCCDDNDDDDGGDGSGGGGGVPAHKGWFEGFSSNSEISKRLTGGKETGSVDAGAEAWFGSCVSEKGCESSIYVHHHQPSCYGSGGVSTEAEQQVALYNAGPPKEELLDLNLPAPVEDAEDGAFSATPLKPADAAHHQQLSPPRSCFTFLGPAAAAPNWFHEEGRAAADT